MHRLQSTVRGLRRGRHRGPDQRLVRPRRDLSLPRGGSRKVQGPGDGHGQVGQARAEKARPGDLGRVVRELAGDGRLGRRRGPRPPLRRVRRHPEPEGQRRDAPDAGVRHEQHRRRAGGEPVKIPDGHCTPVIADWDGDGRWDILSGTATGAVYWYRNVGKPGTPGVRRGRGAPPRGIGGSAIRSSSTPMRSRGRASARRSTWSITTATARGGRSA